MRPDANGHSDCDRSAGSGRLMSVAVKGRILVASRCFPLCPNQRTSLNRVGMTVRCQIQTSRPTQLMIGSATNSE
jgi:hypothetical protein